LSDRQHNQEVLTRILGFEEDDVRALERWSSSPWMERAPVAVKHTTAAR